MRTLLMIALTVAALGCGKDDDKATECQKVVDAARPGLKHMAKELGTSEAEQAKKLLDVCIKSESVTAKCDGLKDEVKIRQCYADAFGIE